MGNAGAGAHYLHVTRFGTPVVTQVVLVSDGALTYIGDDFHVAVRMGREARVRCDFIIVPDPQRAPVHPRRVIVVGKGKVMTGIQPAMMGTAELGEGAYFDHLRILFGNTGCWQQGSWLMDR